MRVPILSGMAALVLTVGIATACADSESPTLPTFEAASEAAGVATVSHDAVHGSPGVRSETTHVIGQGPEGPVVPGGEATLRRTPNGISVTLSMPTPEPGSYEYPDPSPTATGEVGPPEAFSLWVFVFDDPEAEDWSGAFLGAGHIVGGPNLRLSGHISRKTKPFLGDRLQNPDGARVHLAVAPHGALDSELMPGQIQTPSGPGPDIWWLALFD